MSPDAGHPWTSLDEERPWNPVIALPGRKNLGLGRHWHFMTLQFWVANGAAYIAMLFVTGWYVTMVPTNLEIFPNAVRDVGTYFMFHLPAPLPGLFMILVLSVAATWFSRAHPRAAQRLLGIMVNPFESVLSRALVSRQRYRWSDISPYHRVNGYPPVDETYVDLVAIEFVDDISAIGDGQGGWREDQQYYANAAGI